MMTLHIPEFEKLGYMWRSSCTQERNWLQYADNAVITAQNIKGAQVFLNLFEAWCVWANMEIRLDNCSSFGLIKKDNIFCQILPKVWLRSGEIPATPIDHDFVYLGQKFNFSMNNESAKAALKEKVKFLLDTTSDLPIKPQTKLKILSSYVSSQISFDLKLYSFPVTWLDEHLDALCVKRVREWIEAPISSCISEWLQMLPSRCGLGIVSMKNKSQRLALNKRHALKTSGHKDIALLWSDTSTKHIESDSHLMRHNALSSASKELRNDQLDKVNNHMINLSYQGKSLVKIIESKSKYYPVVHNS